MVVCFCICKIIKKCTVTPINMVFYLEKDWKFTRGSRLHKAAACEILWSGGQRVVWNPWGSPTARWAWLVVNQILGRGLRLCLCTPTWFSSARCRFLHVHPVCLTDEIPFWSNHFFTCQFHHFKTNVLVELSVHSCKFTFVCVIFHKCPYSPLD